jgi:thymidylate synthase (FAD)
MTDTTIQLTSEITVDLIDSMGNDGRIVQAARVSTQGVGASDEESYGLIRYLMMNRHGTPFEHGSLTIRVHAPIKVWREWHRHRVGWSYNEESGRYKQLDPIFYIPPRERLMIRPEGFKSARPAFDLANDVEYREVCSALRCGYQASYREYERMLALQVDRGLARDVLGVGIYSACFCTANPRSIMHFLELRTDHPEAKRPSRPLYEIAVAANKLETVFASIWPLTYKAWNEAGRSAP